MSSNPAVVIDNGTWRCRAGMAGEDAPKVVFPPVIGRPRHSGADEYVGDAAIARSGVLEISHPVQHQLVVNWDDMERVWHHCLVSELHIDPQEHPVLITEGARNTKRNRERVTQIMFEKFSVPAFRLSIQAVLSLYASGETTGIVTDCGYDDTYAVAVYEGYALPHAIKRVPVGGEILTERMSKLLIQKGHSFKTSEEKEIVRDIKQSLCFVAEDFSKEMNNAESNEALQKEYKLPDGQVVKVGSERFNCPEALFQPALVGIYSAGVHELTYNSIMATDVDGRRDLYRHIVMSGGSSMFPGFATRMHRQVAELAPPTVAINVIAPPEREYSAWSGGSMMAALSESQRSCVTKAEYEEVGATMVHRKSF